MVVPLNELQHFFLDTDVSRASGLWTWAWSVANQISEAVLELPTFRKCCGR